MSGGGQTVGERMARVEEWIEGHERQCAERQRSMGREIGEVKAGISGLKQGAWAAVVALLAWSAVQLYSDLKTRAAPPAVVAAAFAGPQGR